MPAAASSGSCRGQSFSRSLGRLRGRKRLTPVTPPTIPAAAPPVLLTSMAFLRVNGTLVLFVVPNILRASEHPHICIAQNYQTDLFHGLQATLSG